MDEILRNRRLIQEKAPPREIVRPAQQLPGVPIVVGSQDRKPVIKPIIQKVTVIQKIADDKKQRKRKIKAATKTISKSKRAEYNALKKKLRKTFVTEKKVAYAKGNVGIKKMNVKQRNVARKKLRGDLKAKMVALMKLMPNPGKKTNDELASLIKKVKRLKWN